jgi:hypothetical protein
MPQGTAALVCALLLVANFGHEGRPMSVVPKISYAVLAQTVGTSVSRISFFIRRRTCRFQDV